MSICIIAVKYTKIKGLFNGDESTCCPVEKNTFRRWATVNRFNIATRRCQNSSADGQPLSQNAYPHDLERQRYQKVKCCQPEVGHISMGAGREYPRISPASQMRLEDGSHLSNPAPVQILQDVRNRNSKPHLVGSLRRWGSFLHLIC